MLPRISFFAAAVTDVVEYFKEDAIDVEPNIWFEFCGRPLRGYVLRTISVTHPRSHLPIGVLFDQCSDQTLPWRINLHLRELSVPQVTATSLTLASSFWSGRQIELS
jgi:hypothetical protein